MHDMDNDGFHPTRQLITMCQCSSDSKRVRWPDHAWALVTWDWTDKEHKEGLHHLASK